MSAQNSTDESVKPQNTVLGWPISKWSSLLTIVGLVSLGLFIGLPFLIALLVPIFSEKPENYQYLVDTLDGISIVLGLLGTIASGISIAMTLADQKRFQNEKVQTSLLIDSVGKIQDEVSVVKDYVRQTFESNKELSLQLYNAKIISKQPSSTDFGVSTDGGTSKWAGVCEANETPLHEDASKVPRNTD